MQRKIHSVAAEPFFSPPEPATPAYEESHTVLDEPTLVSAPYAAGETPYAALLKARWAQQRASHVFSIVLLCLLATGPFALVAVIFRQIGGGTLPGTVFFAPLIEELAKVSLPLILLERFPWRWTHPAQLMFVCAASGLIFAVIENLLYQHVYLPNPTPELLQWRWTICTLLHVSCSAIAGLGLCRIWRVTRQHCTRPDVASLIPYAIIAIAVHGCYNALAMALAAWGIIGSHE